MRSSYESAIISETRQGCIFLIVEPRFEFLQNQLKTLLTSDSGFKVFLDRRHGERRKNNQNHFPERRCTDRRLRSIKVASVKISL